MIFCSNYYTNILDMLSVLINIITSTESTTNQVADDGRKFSVGLFKKMKVKISFEHRFGFNEKKTLRNSE